MTLPGDTVLYLLLPLHAATFGVSLPEAGVLLAANRLVRIFGYHWVAQFYGARGSRAACTAAVLATTVATLGYATLSGVWALLIVRLMWGLSFAAMNIATQALPTALLDGAERRSGRARSIVAVGPMVGLIGGAVLAEFYGPRAVFFVLGAIAPLALIFSLRLPSAPQAMRANGPRFAWPGMFNIWAFAMGFTLDGVFVFGLSLLAAAQYPQGAVAAAGALLALRYASEIALSPVGGALAARHGALKILIRLSVGSAIALALLGSTGVTLWAAMLAMVVLRALLQPLPAPVVAATVSSSELVPALAKQATWRDIGAGTGPLVAGLLLPVLPAFAVYGGAGLMLGAASIALLNRGWKH